MGELAGQEILSMYIGQGVHFRGARREEGVWRDIDVRSGSRPVSTLD